MCEDYEAETNYTWICGEGAINCTGFVLKPQCECDKENYYIPSADGRMCIPGISLHTNILCLFVYVVNKILKKNKPPWVQETIRRNIFTRKVIWSKGVEKFRYIQC